MRKSVYIALFCCLLLLQSCFDIIEQVFVKKDGSGNIQLVLNLSRSKSKLNSIIQMKEINGHPIPGKEEIVQKVSEIEKLFKKSNGISNVKTSLDFDNYIATISCDFINIKCLNNALENVGEKENVKPKGVEKLYEFDAINKSFSRINKFLIKDAYKKLSIADKEIFATATYTSIFRFENEISKTSNMESKLAANKKAVMLKLNALDIIANNKSIENKINLKE